MLSIERQHRSKVRRSGLLEGLETAISKGSFSSEEEALAHALARRKALDVGDRDPQHPEAQTVLSVNPPA